MIIRTDNIHTGASRSYSSSHAGYARHDAWDSSGNTRYSQQSFESHRRQTYSRSINGEPADPRPDSGSTPSASYTDGSAPDLGSGHMKNLMKQMGSTSGARRLAISDTMNNLQRLRQQSLNYLIDTLFGRRDRTVPGKKESPDERYYSFFYYSEQETTCFDARGTAVTADGREIPFSISLEMSRSFTQIASQQIDFGKPRLCDPLVINLTGGGADVTDQKFFFDIDADGVAEEISSLGSGSGYLALDRNGNGTIDDGSELFGTAGGNGFSDLAAYDKDGNGWIDEADEIFSKLRIWVQNEHGKSRLMTLQEAGVGAICLRSENTEFSLNRPYDNGTNAVIRQTGIFLYENGGCGTVQQLDLAT